MTYAVAYMMQPPKLPLKATWSQGVRLRRAATSMANVIRGPMKHERPAIVGPRHAEESVEAYALRARQALREAGPIAGAEWKRAYQTVLEEAYRERDIEGLTRVATLGAVALEAAGHLAEAIQQLDYATTVAEGEPTVASRSSSQKAVYLAIQGQVDEAATEAASAVDLSERTNSDEPRSYALASSAIVRCVALSNADPAQVVRSMSEIDMKGFEALGTSVKAWFIPLLFARGEREVARPWIDALSAQADAWRNLPRAADAYIFAIGDQFPRGGLKGTSRIPRPAYNPHARWRARLLLLRAFLYRDRLDTRATTIATSIGDSRSLFGENTVEGNAFCSLIDALRGRDAGDLDPPATVTLVNLPAVLCAMEAVAIGGTQSAAGKWLRWSEQAVPPHVLTSLEWPVLLMRVRGLLQVRAGSLRSAVRSLRDAASWGDKHDYRLESALARSQLAEVLSLGDLEGRRASEIRKLRDTASLVLDELAVPTLLHAYAAARAVGLRRVETATPRLSPRQTEVLRLLSEGLTYKEAARRLGISWRTVQFMVQQIYQKLDVHRKIEAVEKGRELGII